MDQGNCAEIVKSVRRASASHDRTDRDYKEDGKRTVRESGKKACMNLE
nr:hypothetical protein [uncultured Acetatifactor sp.]